MIRFYQVIDRALKGQHPPGKPLRQHQLAKLLGCGQSTIAAYLGGQTLPADTKLAAYAAALGYQAEALAAILTADRLVSARQLKRDAAAFQSRGAKISKGAA